MSVQQIIAADSSITETINSLYDAVTFDINGAAAGRALVSGTWAGVIRFEGSVDGSSWSALECSDENTNNIFSTAGISSNSSVIFLSLSGLAYIRAIFTAYTSGSATVNIRISQNTGNVSIKKIGVISGDDYTAIGHSGDQLKVHDPDVITLLNSIASALGVTTAGILQQAEYTLPTKTEADIPGISYTVPTGKKFLLTSFMASYDAQSTIHIRFKKQTGGTGAWNQLFRITLEVGGQGQSTIPLNFGNGIYIGQAGDKFKITGESSISNKGTVWACFTGAEV